MANRLPDNLLSRSQVERRVGLKRSAIYARMAAGVFPKPVPDELSRTVRWAESEIDAYVDARKQARNMGQAAGSDGGDQRNVA